MSDEVHVGDFGTAFELEIQEDGSTIDISSYTTLQMIFLKPDGVTKLTETAVFTTDGVDGLMQYVTTAASEIDVAGNWKRQGRLAKVGEDFKTEVVVFEVIDNL